MQEQRMRGRVEGMRGSRYTSEHMQISLNSPEESAIPTLQYGLLSPLGSRGRRFLPPNTVNLDSILQIIPRGYEEERCDGNFQQLVLRNNYITHDRRTSNSIELTKIRKKISFIFLQIFTLKFLFRLRIIFLETYLIESANQLLSMKMRGVKRVGVREGQPEEGRAL